MSELQLDHTLVATLAALETHRVEFVLVGDVANAIYDHGAIVSAVAIVPGGYARNVERLAHALHTLNAELGIAGRPDPRGLDWRRMDLRELAPCTFMTAYADIDLDFQPAGTGGFRDLFQDADRFPVAPGVRPYVASLEDLARVGRVGAPARAPEVPLARMPIGTPPSLYAAPPAYATPPPWAAPPTPFATPPAYAASPPPYAHPAPYANPAPYADPTPYADPAPYADPPSDPQTHGPADLDERPAPVRPPGEDDHDPGIWTEEEFRAIRAGRIVF